MGGPEFAALLLPDVQELLTNGAVRPIVRKKAALALLRLLRKSTSDVEELLQHDVRGRAAVASKTCWSLMIARNVSEPLRARTWAQPRAPLRYDAPVGPMNQNVCTVTSAVSFGSGIPYWSPRGCSERAKDTADQSDVVLQVWSVKINNLFEEPNLGVLLGTVTLLLGIVSRNYQGYEAAVPKARPT